MLKENNTQRHFYIEEVILILLLTLSLVGVRITDYSPVDGYGYWIIMVFVFALLAITIAWLQSKHRITDFKKILYEQSWHWLTSLLVVEGVFSLQKTEHLTQENAGLIIMMILAQSTILDGLRVGWRFGLVGIFLGISAIITENTHHFFWIEMIIAVLIVAVTIIIEVWQRKKAKKTQV
jgi:heme exporter protein D